MSAEIRGQIGDYELLTELHSGGMGSVHLARKRGAHGFEKLAAIKTIRADLRARGDIRELFMSEARLVARLRHPSIAQVHDFGEAGGDAYLVMEYVEGVAFYELQEDGVPIPVGPLCRAMAEICRGLHAAHELKDFSGAPLHVVHRDISPQNLMLTFDGRVKILDFGIAHSQLPDSPVTAVGAVRGKPGYMAPEQLTGGEIDRRTDVFLVGIVLHELLTGERLFRADSFTALAHALIHQPIAAPSHGGARIPAALDAVVLRSLARDPHERFGSAHEVAEALAAVITMADGESLEAFAARVLVDRRVKHEQFLHGLLSGAVPAVGRAVGVDTMPARDTIAVDSPRVGKSLRARLAAMLGVGAVLAGGAAAAWRLHAASDVIAATTDSPRAPREIVTAPPVGQTPPAGETRPAVEAPRVVEAPAPRMTAKADDRVATTPAHAKRSPRPPREARAAAEEAPLRPAGTAFLTVGAEPYALVRVNGEEIGPTPVFDHPVAAGPVTVELVTPDKHDVRLRRQLSLGDGEHKRITTP